MWQILSGTLEGVIVGGGCALFAFLTIVVVAKLNGN